MKELILKYLPALLRHLLGFIGAWLVAKGILTQGAIGEESLGGLVLFLTSVISSLVGKYLSGEKVKDALAMPEGSTLEDLKEARE